MESQKNFIKIAQDEDNMRVDQWFKIHFSDLSYVALQKLLRSGQIRLDSKRIKANSRVSENSIMRVPPALVLFDEGLKKENKVKKINNIGDFEALQQMTLYEDEQIIVLNKPLGLAVQGGSGINRHIDGMLECYRNKKGVKPRLVHRLDRDTTGVLLIAKSRMAASFLGEAFKSRKAQKYYWSLVVGVPSKPNGKIACWVIKKQTNNGDLMCVCPHGTKDADYAVSSYNIIDSVSNKFSWLEMQPHTGRTHQLRVHAAYIKHPILGDPKYFQMDQNWCFPGGIQNKLHLHARRIVIPHPNGSILDVTSPLPPHMRQSFNLLGFDKNLYNQDH